jgi:hypothetical protein
MASLNLENIPLRLVGRLLERGVVLERSWITHTTPDELALFVDFTVYPLTLEEGRSQKLRLVIDEAAAYLSEYRQLKHVIARIERPNGFQSTSIHVKLASESILSYQRKEIDFTALVGRSTKCEKHDWQCSAYGATEWMSRISRAEVSSVTEEAKKWSVRALLNCVPDLIYGRLEYLRVPVEAVDIRIDDHGVLGLRVEFPIDEMTDHLRNQYIASVATCVTQYLKEFPVIGRLMVWTRPEYEEPMVAISTLYVPSRDVIAWQEGAQEIERLLEKAVEYNP